MATTDNRGYSAPNTTATQTAGSSRTTSSAPSNETRTEVVNQQNMTPQSLAALEQLIATMQGGGSLQQKAEIARKKQTQDLIQAMLGQYSSGQAFTDAKGLMALNLQKAMEQQQPQIQRAVEGAGTSASSMQGLLSQNMARDAALAASALGAEQAKSYAGTTSNLTGQLANMASTAMDPAGDALLKALSLAVNAVNNKTTTSIGTKTGGGTTENVNGGFIPASGSSSGNLGLTSWMGGDAMNVMDNPVAFAPATVGQYGQKRGQSLSDYLMSI